MVFLLQGWIDEFTRSKIGVLSGAYTEELLKLIPLERLEKKFGGDAANIEAPFFPPSIV